MVDVRQYLNRDPNNPHPRQAEMDRTADEHVQKWSKGKEHWPVVRDLMAYLSLAELMGRDHGRDPQTGFIKGPKPTDWDLDALYQAAIHAHPKTRRKVLAGYLQKGGRDRPESARDSIQRAMGKPVDEKPQRESVRDSINKAMGRDSNR
jgi:hypothetical protein